MAKYIKVNPKVAEFLHLTKYRNQTPDGNYILWQGDMLPFGQLHQLSEIASKIGAIILDPVAAKEEIDGRRKCINLPCAIDKRFRMTDEEIEELRDGMTEEPTDEEVETETEIVVETVIEESETTEEAESEEAVEEAGEETEVEEAEIDNPLTEE